MNEIRSGKGKRVNICVKLYMQNMEKGKDPRILKLFPPIFYDKSS